MIPLIFDLDGTLIDSAPDIHAAITLMLEEADLPPVTFEQTRSFIGNGAPRLVECVAGHVGASFDRVPALLERFLVHYGADPVARTRLYPGVAETLARLAAAGHPLAVCTNKPELPTREILDLFGLSHLFRVIIGGDSLPERKPHPAPLLRAAMLLGGGTAIFVGDSEVDAETAERAQLPLALFTEGYRKTPVSLLPHDIAFSHFDDLESVVQRIATRTSAPAAT